MKRIAIHILIVLILCGVFCDGYFTVSQLSCGRVWLADSEVYAADGWESVTQDDLVTAFQYYCKSRNLTIDGSIADALTSFTTTTFNNICNTLGIDVNSLQANLKKTVEGNLGLRFLMNQQGVLAYNRIFAEFLQNNDLSVGDEVNNKVLQSGDYYFNDYEGTGAFVTDVNMQGPSADNNSFRYGNNDGLQYLLKLGTPYKYSTNDIYNLYTSARPDWTSIEYRTNPINLSFYFSESNYYTASLYSSIRGGYDWIAMLDSGYTLGTSSPNIYDRIYAKPTSSVDSYSSLTAYGFPCILRFSDKIGYLYFGVISFDKLSVNRLGVKSCLRIVGGSDDVQSDVNVYVTTYNNTINNNDYSHNYTIIYNDGDYYEDDDEPSPTTPPDGGGDNQPSGPDIPNWGTPHGTGNIGSDGTFDFDLPFSLPDLNIDWSLKNIGNKFPFCIPSDIVSFYQVLAVEPEAPSIDAHIPLGSFYDWHFEADFSQYDNWARIIRIVEYVGFVITLIYFTVKLVKG